MGSYPQFSFVLRFFCPRQRRSSKPILLVTLLILLTFFLSFRISAQNKIVWSDQEKPIVEQLHGLRKLDDTVRTRTSKDLAMQIRQLPIVPNKLKLAGALAGLSTEGDFGRDTLQEVTTTLALALREQPPAGKPGEPDPLYALYSKFKDQGFVVLAISDEETAQVAPFINQAQNQLSGSARPRTKSQ